MISLADLTVELASIWLIYLMSLAFYRLYFSPLANFPGPKLAALTLWYEFYYDVIKRGRYTWKIKELHKTYGRRQTLFTQTFLIRQVPSYESGNALCASSGNGGNLSSPHELHINDPE